MKRPVVPITRSVAHNRMYWGYIVRPLSEHTGYELAEMHQLLRNRFGPPHLTTRLMTSREFSEYIRAITIWAAEELNIVFVDHAAPIRATTQA